MDALTEHVGQPTARQPVVDDLPSADELNAAVDCVRGLGELVVDRALLERALLDRGVVAGAMCIFQAANLRLAMTFAN